MEQLVEVVHRQQMAAVVTIANRDALAHIRSIAARSTRPSGSTKQCRIMFNFLGDIDTTFDVTLPPTTLSSASQ